MCRGRLRGAKLATMSDGAPDCISLFDDNENAEQVRLAFDIIDTDDRTRRQAVIAASELYDFAAARNGIEPARRGIVDIGVQMRYSLQVDFDGHRCGSFQTKGWVGGRVSGARARPATARFTKRSTGRAGLMNAPRPDCGQRTPQGFLRLY